MTQDELQKMLGDMLAGLSQDEADGKLAGLGVKELQEALSHPQAAATVAEAMEIEKQSVRPGDSAPDFTLPWLTEPGAPAHPGTESLTLSDHFGTRPVALVFGSYT